MTTTQPLEPSTPTGFRIEIDAVVLRSTVEPMRIERIRLRDVGPRDVRIRIEATGVCHSDLSLARGVLAQTLPAVLGHEACGTVVEVGAEVTDLAVGDRVIPLWITPCRNCAFCVRGEAHLCANGSARANEPYAIDAEGQPVYAGLTVGSFAEQTVVPAAAAVKVPSDISTRDAALLGCAVITGLGAVVKTAAIEEGSSVLVIGLGGVGLAAVQGARLAGAATVIAVDRNPDKAALATKLGADHFVLADENTKKAVRELTGGHGPDYGFDCVGLPRTIRDTWSMTRRGGTVCVVGVGGKEDKVTFSALELFHFARTLIGCVGGSLDAEAELPRVFEHVRDGRLDLASMVTGHGDLADIEHAMREMAAGRGIRTVITPTRSGITT